ncbi:MAG: YqaE/Pmp3 family membrane protein [Bacteroidota bacterium]
MATSFASSRVVNWSEVMASQPEVNALPAELTQLSAEEFIALTPKQVRDLTGKRMSIKETLRLKAAQRMVKKATKPNAADIDKTVYIILAIVGLGWLAMGLLSDWSGNDWIINLVLTLLCWLPGVIHAFIKMKDYY